MAAEEAAVAGSVRRDRLDQAYLLFTKAAAVQQALLQSAISLTENGAKMIRCVLTEIYV